MGKKIAIIGVNFYPEDTSTGLYTTKMAEYLSEKGFELTVITGFPYYPQWEIWEDYREKLKYLEEDYKGIKVLRFRQYTPKNPSFLKRIKHIISFTSGSLKNLKRVKQCDLVIAIVPFTSDVWLAHKLAKRTKSKVWVHVQDFEFDAAFESGIVKNPLLKRVMSGVLYYFERKLFNKSDILSTISYSMLDKAKGKTSTELFYFPNWIEEDFINPERAKYHPYLKGNGFKILYSGNIGAKQDWEGFIEFVNLMRERRDVEFVVVGDGAKRDWLFNKLEGYPNVSLYPPVPYSELPDLLCSADLHILFQKESVVDTVMPSKLLGMMASGRPSLITGNEKSEVAKVIKDSEGGMFFKTANVSEMRDFVDLLIKKPELKNYYGQKARDYVISKFSKKKKKKKIKKKRNDLINIEKT